MAETNDNALPESPAQAFKEAMRRLAATVTIVTAAKGDESYGMTMTAVTSLSMDPPSLVICVNRNASLHPVLAGRQEAPFCEPATPRSPGCSDGLCRRSRAAGSIRDRIVGV